jgi:hypothetical protein
VTAAVWYHAKLGDYLFDAMPAVEPECERVVRPGPDPNVAVAVNWTIPLICRVRETADVGSAALLGAFLAACVHTDECPAFLITDAAGTPLPEWGEIDPDAVDDAAANLGWEDVRLVSFRLPQGEGQLMAGATFFVTIQARRSFPDADGICELDQEYVAGEDASGNETERLETTYIRFARAGGANIETAAVVARIRLACPVGYTRTVGGDRGYVYREPLYPERHVATGVVSEIALTTISGSTGAKDATLGERIVDDPARGLRRTTNTARTTGGDDPLGWVEDQAPSSLIVSGETTFEEGTEKTATGEWRRIEALDPLGKTTKVVRTLTIRGGRREVGAIKMSPPVRPVVQRGAFEPYRITETLEVYALDPKVFEDFKIPPPLPLPFVFGPEDSSEPRVSEDATVAEQRLWVWAITREYGWNAVDHPRTRPEFRDAVFLPPSVVSSP